MPFEFSACPHHENNHGHDEERCRQHYPAFKQVFIKLESGEQDGNANARHKRGAQGSENRLAQVGPPDLGEISQRDPNDERSFDPFAQGYDESL